MKTVISTAVVVAALVALSACATPATAPLTEEERCTRYGSLWHPVLGRCMHPGSGGA